MIDPGLVFSFTTVVTLVTGTMFLMWLGEQITERGIGNGISLIISRASRPACRVLSAGPWSWCDRRVHDSPVAGDLLFAVGVTALVVFVESGQRRIPVHYAKRQVGRKVYGGRARSCR